MALSELNCLRLEWPKTQCISVIWSGCGKTAKNALDVRSREIVLIALFHIEIAQLWRCPVMWCTVWKGTAQDCVDHMRRTHDVPPLVKAANLARYFPPWTVTRVQWTDMTRLTISGVVIDTLLFSRIGVPLSHCYRIVSRSGTHAAFRETYMRREESDAASVRLHHRWCAKELARLSGQNGGCFCSTFSHSSVSLPGPEASQAGGGGGGAFLLRLRNRFACLGRKRPLYKL